MIIHKCIILFCSEIALIKKHKNAKSTKQFVDVKCSVLEYIVTHEMGHHYFTFKFKVSAWKWSKHSLWAKKIESQPYTNEYDCSVGDGHEYYNPSGRCACKKQQLNGEECYDNENE